MRVPFPHTYNAANQITNTGFAYDDAGRMTADSDSVVEQTVSYTYDVGGQRTTMAITLG